MATKYEAQMYSDIQEISKSLEDANRLNGAIIKHYLPEIKLSLLRIADALEQRNRILKSKGE